MIDGTARPARRHLVHAAHIDEKRHQLVGAGRQFLRLCEDRRLIREHLGVMDFDHAGAGAGRRDDIVVAGESGDDLARDRLRVRLVAGIVSGLTAAGLRRHLDRAAGLFQQFDGGEADARPEQIDKAGHQ